MKQTAAWAREHWWVSLSILFVVVGICLRTRRMFISPIPFWSDEGLSGLEVMSFRFDKPSVRPVGFMLVSKFLGQTFGASDVVLRFLPWLAGVLGSVIAIPLARRLFTAPAARVLLVALIALQPNAIDFCKEFKPYSVSLCLHLFCLWAAASYWDTRSLRWLLATMGVALVGVLFAQDVLFAYPGLYLALGLTAWRARITRHTVLVGAGAAATLGLLLVLYFAYWRHMGGLEGVRQGKKIFGFVRVWWSVGYDLFPVNPDESTLAWYLRKYVEIATFPGARHTYWTGWGPLDGARLDVLRQMDTALWVLLHALSLVLIVVRRRLRDALLLITPLLVLTAFNVLQRWPYGAFRTNLFTLAYATPLVCLALDTDWSARARPFRQLVPTLLLCVAPLLLFERTWHRVKVTSGNSEFWEVTRALTELYDRKPSTNKRELVMLDGYMCYVWQHYEKHYPYRREVFDELSKRFRWRCVKGWNRLPLADARKHLKRRRETVWLVLLYPPNWEALKRDPLPDYRIAVKHKIEPDVAMLVRLDPK